MNNYRGKLLPYQEYLDRRVRPGTVRIYLYVIRKWFDFLNGNPPSKESAQRYVDLLAKTLTASTVNVHGHAVMSWLKWEGEKVVLRLPQIAYPDPEYLNMREIDKLLQACKTLLEKVLVVVLFDTAVRINELLGLGLQDIDWKHGYITVTRKGGRREDVNISEKALIVLRYWVNVRGIKRGRVFDNISYWESWNLLRKLGKRAGLHLHPHTFRHSRAVQMMKKGATLQDISQHLGHLRIETTSRIYSRFKPADLKERIPEW